MLIKPIKLIDQIKTFLKKLPLFDKITIAYNTLILIIFFIFYDKIGNKTFIFCFHVGILSFIILWNKFKKNINNDSIKNIISDWYPLSLLTHYYLETIYFKKIIFDNDIDSFLVKVENMLFGFQPSIIFYKTLPYLPIKELMCFFYSSHFYLGLTVAIYFYITQKKIFYKLGKDILITFQFCYLFFMFIPSSGPQFYFNNSIFHSHGGIFYHFLAYIENNIEIPSGAFPSSHVAIATIIIIYSLFFINKKRIKIPIIFIATGLIISTVYIRAHYLIDVIAGIIVGSLSYFINNNIIFKQKE